MNISQKENKYYLSEIQGMIATCAIENPDHHKAYLRCQTLVDKYGLLAKIDWDKAMKYCYKD